MIESSFFVALAQVIFIDLVLAADNAVVIALATSGLHGRERDRAIAIGLGGAFLFRIGFAVMTVQLLRVIGLMLAGGLLLLWVAWRLARDIANGPRAVKGSSMRSAVWRVLLADVAMSLDNVLAVAGAARDSVLVLVIGLSLSIVLMGVAANYLATFMEDRPWLAWVGVFVVVWVALEMVWAGAEELS